MAEPQPPEAQGDAGPVTIPAALSPADAREVHARLLAALQAARETGGPLAVEIDGERPWPCALQLLAAAERSAREAGLDFAPGTAAAAARLPIDAHDSTEQDPR